MSRRHGACPRISLFFPKQKVKPYTRNYLARLKGLLSLASNQAVVGAASDWPIFTPHSTAVAIRVSPGGSSSPKIVKSAFERKAYLSFTFTQNPSQAFSTTFFRIPQRAASFST